MKTIHQFIAQLGEHDIKLRYDDERLQVNAPKGAMTAELASQIKARKDEIIAFLNPTTKAPVIPRIGRNQDLPLSFSQQRMWFMNQLDGDSATYNVPSAYLLEGDLNLGVIKACFRVIVARHEVLRTSFGERDGYPFQVIAPDPNLPVPVVDFRHLIKGHSAFPLEEEVRELVHLEGNKPFNLAQGPMLRVTILVLRDNLFVLMMNMHHIVADGWSMDVLLGEFGQLYHAAIAGLASPLPPLPIQYADFAHWQRHWLAGDRLERQASYWRQQLTGAPALLELPLDKPRPANQDFEGDLFPVELPPELTRKLIQFSQEQGLTLFMTLMAGFNLLMARLSGQDDIAVGSPINNREQAELGGLIGFFSNTFILRTRVHAQMTFRQLAVSVKEHLIQVYGHQDLPFEHLVDILKPERSMSYSPLFQVMFTLAKPQSSDAGSLDWKMTSIDHGALTSKFDLTLNLTETEHGVAGFMEYSKAIFTSETIHRWFAYYLVLLENMLRAPDEKLGSLPILSQLERQQILTTWNQTRETYTAAGCIHTCFEARVAQSPENCALVFDASTVAGSMVSMTFNQLNREANRVAHYLISRGVGPDDRVGLCLPRSPEMVVSMLGILKAGAAYVPLDPAYPQERLTYMLRDAAIDMVITNPAMAGIVPQGDVEKLHLDENLLQGMPETNPNVSMTSDNLLYVTYTSGSTGLPKGIALAHDALVNLILWHRQALPQPGGVLQFASMSFDASYHEIFAAWLAGDTLYLIPEELRYDTASLPQLLAKHQVRKVILPVVVLQQWAEFYPQGSPHFQHLRHIITTGEQLQITRPMVALFKTMPGARLHNHYGPAETHVVTAYSFNQNPDTWAYHAPIGFPVFNTGIYILDQNLEPVPPGVKGHLYIGGTNLARGYLGKPALSADRFVPSPFAAESSRCVPSADGQPWVDHHRKHGERLYKTGDLARYLADGNIEFLGRSDHMVKLRGFRIEPGEIEAVLTRDPRVNRAVVVMRGTTDKRLLAYLILNEPIAKPAETLRDLVGGALPEFMIPAAFIVMESLPLSPTGKVDTRALPDPDFSVAAEELVAPRNPVETLLRHIWADVLALDAEKIGVFQNFFTLGGHSLLATRVVSRLRRELEIDLPLRSLFANTTIATFGQEIANVLWLKQGKQAALETNDDAFEEEL